MVWNSEQSPLYRTVESFNSTSGEPEKATCDCSQETEPAHEAPEFVSGQQRNPPPRGNCGSPGGFLQKLTSDRDSMLIIALIILLWREKADMKLIAALAFILLA